MSPFYEGVVCGLIAGNVVTMIVVWAAWTARQKKS